MRKNMRRKGIAWGHILAIIIMLVVLVMLTYFILKSRGALDSGIKGVVGCGADTEAIRLIQKDFSKKELIGGKCSQFTNCDDLEVLFKAPFKLFAANHPDCEEKYAKHCCYATAETLGNLEIAEVRMREEFMKMDMKSGGFYYITNLYKPEKISSEKTKTITLNDGLYQKTLIIKFKPPRGAEGKCFVAIRGNNGAFIVLGIQDCIYGEKVAFDIFKVYPINLNPTNPSETYSIGFIDNVNKQYNIPENVAFDEDTLELKNGLIFTVNK